MSKIGAPDVAAFNTVRPGIRTAGTASVSASHPLNNLAVRTYMKINPPVDPAIHTIRAAGIEKLLVSPASRTAEIKKVPAKCAVTGWFSSSETLAG